MQITVFGASGKVGSLVVEEALRRGFTVVAFVHSHDLFSPSGKLIIQKGDVRNPEDVAKALHGSDAVVSCLSSWGTKRRDVLTSAMRAIVPAMREQKIKRIVSLSGIGLRENPSDTFMRLLRLGAKTPAGKVFLDAQEHVQVLAGSDLDWTVICSPVMNNIGGTGYELNLKTGLPTATVSRAAVAAAMLYQIGSAEYIHRTPTIHRK